MHTSFTLDICIAESREPRRVPRWKIEYNLNVQDPIDKEREVIDEGENDDAVTLKFFSPLVERPDVVCYGLDELKSNDGYHIVAHIGIVASDTDPEFVVSFLAYHDRHCVDTKIEAYWKDADDQDREGHLYTKTYLDENVIRWWKSDEETKLHADSFYYEELREPLYHCLLLVKEAGRIKEF